MKCYRYVIDISVKEHGFAKKLHELIRQFKDVHVYMFYMYKIRWW